MILANTKYRILHYIDSKGISKSSFYEETGIKRGLLDKDKMDSTVTDVFIAKILAVYNDINPDWLLTGRGNMLLSNKAASNTQKITGDGNYMVGKGSVSVGNVEQAHLLAMIEEYKNLLNQKDEYIKELLSDNKELRSQVNKLIDKLQN